MGLVTLSLQRMGPPLINELSHNGKKAGASEGAQRPHTARPSIAPRGPERARSQRRVLLTVHLWTHHRQHDDLE